MNKQYSPDFSGVELKQINDKLYQCPITYKYYYMDDKGKVEALRSPGSGGTLVPTDNPNIFHDEYSGLDCYVYSDGTVKPLDGGPGFGALHYNEEGKLISQYTMDEFEFDIEGRRFIPLFNPETHEQSHIEGNELVGNETGERFEISEDGGILTPQEIAFRAVKARENKIVENYDGKPEDLIKILASDKELNRLKKEWRSIITKQAWGDNAKKAQIRKVFNTKGKWGVIAGIDGIDVKSVLSSAIEATEDIGMNVITKNAEKLTVDIEKISRGEHLKVEEQER